MHMQVGKLQGLSKAQLLDAMSAKASTEKELALLSYANEVIRHRGQVSDETLAAVSAVGYSEKALLEVIGIIGVYTSLQYIRHVANPEHDFPMVTEFNEKVHGA